MKNIRQEISDCNIPGYLQDILTNNYCPNFLRMSMVRESNDYTFRYNSGRYKKLQVDRLNTYMKIVLIKSILDLIEKNEEWLIKSDTYLIEPELIYSVDNSVDISSLKLLFYPDYAMEDLSTKLRKFCKKITDLNKTDEVELMNQLREIIGRNDFNRARIFIDKNLLRMETRT